MSIGERPIGAAKGKQSDAEALCQPPPPARPTASHRHHAPAIPALCDGEGSGGMGGSGPTPRGKQAAGKGALCVPSAQGLGRQVAARGLFALGITRGAEAHKKERGRGERRRPEEDRRATAEPAKRKPW